MAPNTMKAALCKEPGQPLVIENVPVPTPTGRNVLVRVQVASLCHSDLLMTSPKGGLTTLPQIIGHEAISIVEALGPDAAPFGIKPGDQIGAPLWQDMCLECWECKNIGPQYCPKITLKGLSSAGYFAEYALVDAATAVVIPRLEGGDADVSPAQLAPIFCAGITVWDALERAQIRPGETVAIVGVGGLGEIATKYAHALGAKVLGLDVHDGQLESVRDGGSADGILNTRELQPEDVKARIAAMNHGRMVDAVVVTSGSVAAYQTGISILRPDGRLMVVGIPHEPMSLNLGMVALQSFRIIGAKVTGPLGAARCLEFSLRKGIYPKIHPRKFQLEDINEMMALMQAGKVHEGRMTVQFF
ncbi:hypothetical protein PEBR_00428 [Penicillium brasilianum]|uniref:Enoyl reductase (ER) domain-containing protein n=1 Tax=Penicillium brasilianum TaxID=104259 RepID=A0A1S9S0F5_PENBI|nr:hypothetical protein PEBR_00428 [Penicillium brasilianum]